jgi:hypothetical protein
MPLDAHLWGAAQSIGSSGRGYQQIREACPACLSGCPPFPTVPPETIIAGLSFQDKASFHRVSRNGSATEPMRLVIAYTVKVGEPNTTWPPK